MSASSKKILVLLLFSFHLWLSLMHFVSERLNFFLLSLNFRFQLQSFGLENSTNQCRPHLLLLLPYTAACSLTTLTPVFSFFCPFPTTSLFIFPFQSQITGQPARYRQTKNQAWLHSGNISKDFSPSSPFLPTIHLLMLQSEFCSIWHKNIDLQLIAQSY